MTTSSRPIVKQPLLLLRSVEMRQSLWTIQMMQRLQSPHMMQWFLSSRQLTLSFRSATAYYKSTSQCCQQSLCCNSCCTCATSLLRKIEEDTIRQFARRLLAFFYIGQDSTRPVDQSLYLKLVFDKEFNPSMCRNCGEPLFNVSGNLTFERANKSYNWKQLSRQEKKSINLSSHADILALLWGTQRKSNCQWICDQLCFQVAQVVEAERFLVFHKSFVVMTESDSGSKIKPRRSLSDPNVLAHRAREHVPGQESDKKKKEKTQKGRGQVEPAGDGRQERPPQVLLRLPEGNGRHQGLGHR